MTDLDICRLSAEALGKKLSERWTLYQDKPALCFEDGLPWNPITIAEQRWECVEWLLRNGDLWLSAPDDHEFCSHENRVIVELPFPASEFPARAVAELHKRKAA